MECCERRIKKVRKVTADVHRSDKKISPKRTSHISPPYNQKIIDAIDSLAQHPRPVGCKQLKGENAYRIRIADYRVIYTIEDIVEIVEVQRIGHRRDAYR